jgi:hypothetical protein
MKKSDSDLAAFGTLANHELVVLAAYLVGAGSASADTEDIAMKANQLAPGRFSWRRYKDQINIESVRKRLWDSTKPDKGAYLIGSEKVGWRLTKAGFDFALRQLQEASPEPPMSPRSSQLERLARTRETRRMTADGAFQKIRSGMASSVTRSEAERFFRIDDYIAGQARAAKIERFRILASGNQELQRAIDILSELVREA